MFWCRPLWPGSAVCGGGAYTVGLNWFAPPGSRRGAFSVGETGAGGDVVVVVVVVVEVSGAFSSPAQPAVITPIVMRAPSPATAERRRGKRLCVRIAGPICVPALENGRIFRQWCHI